MPQMLPRPLEAFELGVLPARRADSFRAGWWALKNQWANPLMRTLLIALAFVCLVAAAVPLIDGREWVSHLTNALALGALAVVVTYGLSVAVYERCRLSSSIDLYLSHDCDAVLSIERRNIGGVPTYQPRQHTVRRVGQGQGRRMRDALIPRLANLVEAEPGAAIYVRSQNQAVHDKYLEDFERHKIDVQTAQDGRFPTITYPRKDSHHQKQDLRRPSDANDVD